MPHVTTRFAPAAVPALLAALAFGASPAGAQAGKEKSVDPEKAVQKYSKAVEKTPNDAEAWYLLAAAHVMLEQWSEAEPAARKAVELDPENAKAHFRLGEALAGLERHDEAVAALKAALAKDETLVPAHVELGDVHAGQGRHAEAIEAYKGALKQEGSDKAALYTNIGDAYFDSGDVEQATRWFERTLEVAPEDPVTHFNLGAIYRRLASRDHSLFGKAADAFAKASDLDRKDAKTAFLAAETALMAGRKDQARTLLDRYFALDPAGTALGAQLHAVAKEYRTELAK